MEKCYKFLLMFAVLAGVVGVVLGLPAQSSANVYAQPQPVFVNAPLQARNSQLISPRFLLGPLSLVFLVPFFLLLFLTLMPALSGGFSGRSGALGGETTMQEMTRLAKKVFAAIENESCLQKSVCEMGGYVRSMGNNKEVFLGVLSRFAPVKMQPYLGILREATVSSNYVEYCNRYACSQLDSSVPTAFQPSSGSHDKAKNS